MTNNSNEKKYRYRQPSSDKLREEKQNELNNQMSATIQSSNKGIRSITKIEKELRRTLNQIKKFIKENVERIKMAQKNDKPVNGEKLDEKIKDLHAFLQIKRQQYGEISDDVLSQKEQTIELFYLLNDFINAERMHYRYQSQSQRGSVDLAERGISYMVQLEKSYYEIFKKKVDFKERFKKDQIRIVSPQGQVMSGAENLVSFAHKISGVNSKNVESSIHDSQMHFLKENVPSLTNLKESSVQISFQNSCGSLMGSKVLQNQSQMRNRINGFQSYKKLLQSQVKQSQIIKQRSASEKAFYNVQNIERTQFMNGSNVNLLMVSTQQKPFSSRFFNGKMLNLFNSPPNPNLPPKQYRGTQFQYEKQLTQSIYYLDRGQDIRKFRLSNLKDRSVIFQNQHLQIGFHSVKPIKSQQVFGSFDNYLKLHLYFGNKSQGVIEKFSIRNSSAQKVKGQNNTLFYVHPSPIRDIIFQKTQNKVDLVFVVLDFPYKICSFIVTYEINGYQYKAKIILPILMTKFVDYYPLQADFYSQAHQIFSRQTKMLYRVQNFRLSSHIHPLHIRKFIPQLEVISADNSNSYQKFLQERSITDFQQICRVKITNRFNSVLKITVRPNLEVVLQGFLDEPNLENYILKQAQKRIKYYLFNLKMILSHW